MYKLVLLDIDGTTINSNKKITERTKNAIRRAIDKGVKVCFCTGRNKRSGMDAIGELSFNIPIVASDGSLIIDTEDDTHLMEKLIPAKFTRDTIRCIDEEDLYLEIFTNNMYYKYCKKEELEKYNYSSEFNNMPFDKEALLLKGVKYISNINEFFKDEVETAGFMVAGNKTAIEKVVNFIEEQKCEEVEVRKDLWEDYIFIIPKGCKKSYGLKFLCQHYNILREETIAIGDQLNDLDMIEEAGLGIAMGNADQKVKNIADYITKTNDEDGVAFAIEKFILS